MFAWADNFYNGPVQTAINGALTLTLTQACAHPPTQRTHP